MTAICDAMRKAELHKLCIPRELGGMNAPLLLYFLSAEMLARYIRIGEIFTRNAAAGLGI